jgi:methylmalonyl-CoA decarboxylase subunit alpha
MTAAESFIDDVETGAVRLHRAGEPRSVPAIGRPAHLNGDHPAPDLRERTAQLHAARDAATNSLGIETARHRQRGKLTCRERIEALLDDGSFTEIEMFARHRATGFGLEGRRPATDGVIAGWGTIDGRQVAVFAHDARIFGGALGETSAAKIHKLMDLAEDVGVPIIGLNDGGGARIQEGVTALAGFGGIFARNVRASGVIPQISVILGSCAGGATYSPALTDFTFMVLDTSSMFITGPDVVAAVTGENIGIDELGGARLHATRTGVASVLCDDELSCLQEVRELLSYLPSNNRTPAPIVATDDPPNRRSERLLETVPTDPRRCYDVRDVIEDIVDDGEYFEIHRDWAPNIVCMFARIDGRTIGLVANQPAVLAGVLDIAASEKAARFVRTCDAFGIPLVTLVDVPGFLPGSAQEHNGIIRHGAKLLYAYCEATVPRAQVILRKAFGGAYIVMDSKSIGCDVSLAWPGNEIAVMGAESAASIIFRTEIAGAKHADLRRAELVAEYTDQLMHPFAAAERGLVDDVIDPRETRSALIRAFRLLAAKRAKLPERRHGIGPL